LIGTIAPQVNTTEDTRHHHLYVISMVMPRQIAAELSQQVIVSSGSSQWQAYVPSLAHDGHVAATGAELAGQRLNLVASLWSSMLWAATIVSIRLGSVCFLCLIKLHKRTLEFSS
jgi:hypothetical protein